MTALALALALTAAAEPALGDVLARAAAYVADFERQLSGIVAEERYQQVVTFARTRRPAGPSHRELRSDLLLVKPPGADDWFQFRDVFEVDASPVRDRNERLVKLFIDRPPTLREQIAGILAESARYNIGSLMRTVNTPILPLQILEAKNQPRFTFKRIGDAAPARMTREAPAPPGHFRLSAEVWVVHYAEQRDGTLIRTTAGRDLPARGRFWIEPATGRVLMTELLLESRDVRGAIDVNYQSEPLVGLLMPIEMRERYDHQRDGSTIDGFATYGHFRQFQVNVSERFLIKE